MRVYRYYSAETLSLDMSGMMEDLSNAPDGAVVLLHTTGHNPCGFDPSQEEWQRLAALCKVGGGMGSISSNEVKRDARLIDRSID